MSEFIHGSMPTDLSGGFTLGQPFNQPAPLPKTFISIDLECTGLEMDKHGICQIGAWATGETEDHFKDYFVMDVNPNIPRAGERRDVKVSAEALEVNGFTPARIEDGIPLGSALRDFNRWLRKWESSTTTICVGQNVAFDLAWLKKVFYQQGLDTDIFRRNVDCYTLSFLAFGMPMGLQKVAGRLGISCGSAHDALSDAYIASKVFHRLIKFLAKGYPSVQPPPNLSSVSQTFQQGGTESPCVK